MGDVTITKCGGCFKNVNATINYTGQIITEGNSGTCSHGSEDVPRAIGPQISRKITSPKLNLMMRPMRAL